MNLPGSLDWGHTPFRIFLDETITQSYAGRTGETAMEVILFALFAWSVMGVVGYFIAKSKGRDPHTGCIWGMLLGPIGWLIVALSEDQKPKAAPDGRLLRQCPFCAEMILAEAILCRYCGNKVHAAGPPTVKPITAQATETLATPEEKTASASLTHDQSLPGSQLKGKHPAVIPLLIFGMVLVIAFFAVMTALNLKDQSPAPEQPSSSSVQETEKKASDQTTKESAEALANALVWITKDGIYHKTNCRRLNRLIEQNGIDSAARVVLLKEVGSRKPCPECNPPILVPSDVDRQQQKPK